MARSNFVSSSPNKNPRKSPTNKIMFFTQCGHCKVVDISLVSDNLLIAAAIFVSFSYLLEKIKLWCCILFEGKKSRQQKFYHRGKDRISEKF